MSEDRMQPARIPCSLPDLEQVAGLVKRLRQVERGWGHSQPSVDRRGEPCHTLVPYGNMMNEAADMIATLSAEVERLRGMASGDKDKRR